MPDEKCHPKCRGLDVYQSDFKPPAGWVEIQRCDECGVYKYDDTAARVVSKRAEHINPDTRERRLITQEMSEEDIAWVRKQKRLRNIVPAYDASLFGLTFELEPVTVGQRIMLRHDVERYPHFIAEAGMIGTVRVATKDYISVKMDDDLENCKEWDNCIEWTDDYRAGFWEDCAELGGDISIQGAKTGRSSALKSNLSNGPNAADGKQTGRISSKGPNLQEIPKDAEHSLGALRCPKCGGTTISLWYFDGQSHSCRVKGGRLKASRPDSFDPPAEHSKNRFLCDTCGYGHDSEWPVPAWIDAITDWDAF